MSPGPVAVRSFLRLLIVAHCALLAANVSHGAAPTRDDVRLRVRNELATQLGEKPESLAFDKPVRGFGADDLDVIEWVLAVEEAFQINIRDEKLFDPKTKAAREDLSIELVTALAWDLLRPTAPPEPRRDDAAGLPGEA